MGSPRNLGEALGCAYWAIAAFAAVFTLAGLAAWSLSSIPFVVIGFSIFVWLARVVTRARRQDVFTLTVDGEGIAWGWTSGRHERERISFARMDHVNHHDYPDGERTIEIVTRDGWYAVVPAAFMTDEKDIIRVLRSRVEVRGSETQTLDASEQRS